MPTSEALTDELTPSAQLFDVIVAGTTADTKITHNTVQIAAAEHPDYASVSELVALGSSLRDMKQSTLFAGRSPTALTSLTHKTFAVMLFEAFKQGLTGFFHIRNDKGWKIVSVHKGLPTNVSSSFRHELLGAVLLGAKKLDNATSVRAAALAHESNKSVGWAILQLKLLTANDLLEAHRDQAFIRLNELMTWTAGTVEFYEDARASTIAACLPSSLLDVFRQSLKAQRLLDAAAIQRMLEPLLQRTDDISLMETLGNAVRDLTTIEAQAYDAVKRGISTAKLRERIASFKDPEQRTEFLGALLIFSTLGLLPAVNRNEPKVASPPKPDVTPAAEVPSPQEKRSNPAQFAPESSAAKEPSSALASLFLKSKAVKPPEGMVVEKSRASVVAEESRDDAFAATFGELPSEASTASQFGLGDADDDNMPGDTTGPGEKAPTLSEYDEYQKQKQLETMGKRFLLNFQPSVAQKKFQELVDRQEKPTDALAYLALTVLLVGGPSADKKALAMAEKALQRDHDNAICQAVLGRVLESMGKDKAAKKHETTALQLSANSHERLAEVRSVLLITATADEKRKTVVGKKTTVRGNAKAESDAERRRTTIRRTVTPGKLPTQLGRRTVLLHRHENNWHKAFWAIPIATLVILFIVAIGMRYGRSEYLYLPNDPMFWLRRSLLFVSSIVGMCCIARVNPLEAFRQFGWEFKGVHLVPAVVLGIVVGVASPLQRVSTPLQILLPMVIVHVISEEFFFRGLLTTMLEDKLDRKFACILSGIIYGLYRLSFYSFWYETLISGKLVYCGLAVLVLGWPLAVISVRSRSIAPALISHTLIDGIMMTWSALKMRP